MSETAPYPKYLGPRDINKVNQAIERIAKALIDRRASFLFGAGMSRDSGIPTGNKLVKEILNRFFPMKNLDPDLSEKQIEEELIKLIQKYPFEAIVETDEKKPGKKRNDLTKFLKEFLLDADYKKSMAHDYFVSVMNWGGLKRIDQIFTTNFDYLLEKAIGEDRTKTIGLENPGDIRAAQQEGLIPIIHLHGILDGKYIITESDVFSQEYRVLTSEFLASLYLADAFVFVGYSMNDPDFKSIYMLYRDEIKSRGLLDKTTYVVSPPKSSYHYILGSDLWDLRGAVWIPLSAEAFFQGLKDFMDSHSEKSARKEVMKNLKIKDDAALTELQKKLADLLEISKTDALYFLLELRTQRGIR